MMTTKEVKKEGLPGADVGATLEKRGEEMMASAIDGNRDAAELISDISDLMCSNDIVIEDKELEDGSLELIAKLIGIRDGNVVDGGEKIDAIMQLYRAEIQPFLSRVDEKIEEGLNRASVRGMPSVPDRPSREELAGPINDPKIALAKIRRLLSQDKFMKTDRKEEADRLMLKLEEIEKGDDADGIKIGEIKKLYNAEDGIRQFLAAEKEDARKKETGSPSEADFPEQQSLEEETDNMRLAELEEAVDRAREKYAEICCREKQRNLSFKKIFHKMIHVDTDTHRAALEEYKSRLKEFVEFKTDRIRFIEMKGDNHEEEINALIKKLEADEKIRLADFMTEFQENQRPYGDRKKAETMGEAAICTRWYGSQKFASKDATGKALREIGLVDPSGRFPAMERMKKLKEKLDQELARLNGAIADFSRNLTKEGKRALLGGIVAVGMALLIGHGAITHHPSKQSSENLSVRHSAESLAVSPASLDEKIGSIRMGDGSTSAGPAQPEGYYHKASSADHAEKDDANRGNPAESQEKQEKKVLLKVGEGSSLEGTTKNYLKSTGLNESEAGIKAGLMADEFAKSRGLKDGPYSLIHPGATIEIADGKIKNISGDDRLGYLRQNSEKVVEKTEASGKDQYEKNPLIADRSAQELIKMKNSIFSKYKGEISSDKDIYNQAKRLQEKSDGLGLSFLSQSEQEQLNVLNEYKRGIQKTFRQMMAGFLNTKDDKIMKMDATAYLANGGNSGAAGVFGELKRTIAPEEMEKYNLNPKQSDRVIDWSRRVVTYMLKKQIETKS